jgi:hypothetical protein
MRPLPIRTILASAGIVAIAGISAPAISAASQRLSSTVSTKNEADTAFVFLNQVTTGNGGGLSGQVGPSPYGTVASSGVFGVFGPSSTTDFGSGVVGLSSTGYGVVGEAVGGTYAAVYGQNYSAFGGPGVQGVSAGNGVVGQSSKTNAIVGQTTQTSSSTSAGVLGQDLANDGLFNDGVLGTTTNGGYGVEGDSSSDALGGVEGVATTGFGVRGNASGTNAAVLGYNSDTASNGGGPGSETEAGVYAESANGTGLYSYSTNFFGGEVENDSGVSTFEVINDTGTGNPIILYNKETNTFPFYVSATGNITSAGYVVSKGGGTLAKTRNPSSDLVTYGAQQTESTVEDFGSGQLVNGSAAIALKPDFAQTINMASSYMVFITPDGDTNGLYVAQKSPTGFVVRETRSGHSTLAFDYRIVARPYGQVTARLPHFSQIASAPTLRPDGTSTRHVSERWPMSRRLAQTTFRKRQNRSGASNSKKSVPR